MDMQAEKRVHGFLFTKVEQIYEYNITVYYLTHEKTKTEYLHLERNDLNNIFAIAFRTTPQDSKGVAHILEHIVLCGSKVQKMSLPSDFSDPENYFEEFLKFLHDYKQLYSFPNTHILIHNVLDEINVSNLKDDDIFNKCFDLASNKGSNQFLKDFFLKIERFGVSYNEVIEDYRLEQRVDVPLSPKKKHEIAYLAKEIAGICEERNLDVVVDFGSGLGYLDQLIFEEMGLNVLGLECNENHFIGAKKRQRKYHADSVRKVKYIKHFISENSDEKIQGYLENKFGKSNGFCITGLHACADLSIDAINLFLKMPNARAMVIIPCCYHKLSSFGSSEDRFKNFPMSECLKRICEAYNGFQFLRVPFLRLATQPPCRSDEDLRDSVFYLVSRAVLQVYAHRQCGMER